jgi:hypothetical protein
MLPQVDAQTQHVLASIADTVSIRVVEYHSYTAGFGLMTNNHYDSGSLYTMLIMLSEPGKDFEGGPSQQHARTHDMHAPTCTHRHARTHACVRAPTHVHARARTHPHT